MSREKVCLKNRFLFSFICFKGGCVVKKHNWSLYCLLVILFVIILFGLFFPFDISRGEENEPYTIMYVTASQLNGRAEPSKKAMIEAQFDHLDEVRVISWSKNHHWIEVIGGETGTVWVWWEYLSEQQEDYTTWWNEYGSAVKIRKEPYGKVIGYLKKGKEVVVTQTIFGWGKTDKGWIDLSYLTEED